MKLYENRQFLNEQGFILDKLSLFPKLVILKKSFKMYYED
jgi:hypothetical protein